MACQGEVRRVCDKWPYKKARLRFATPRQSSSTDKRRTKTGAAGIRTLDLLHAMQTRSQLRHGPVGSNLVPVFGSLVKAFTEKIPPVSPGIHSDDTAPPAEFVGYMLQNVLGLVAVVAEHKERTAAAAHADRQFDSRR